MLYYQVEDLKEFIPHYSALQSFDAPYNRALFGCIRESKPDRRIGRRDAEVQIEEIRANGTKGVTVKRVK